MFCKDFRLCSLCIFWNRLYNSRSNLWCSKTTLPFGYEGDTGKKIKLGTALATQKVEQAKRIKLANIGKETKTIEKSVDSVIVLAAEKIEKRKEAKQTKETYTKQRKEAKQTKEKEIKKAKQTKGNETKQRKETKQAKEEGTEQAKKTKQINKAEEQGSKQARQTKEQGSKQARNYT